MRIDPEVEAPTRKMLGHAMRGELDEIPSVLQTIGDQRAREAIGLCVLIAGYTAVDVCGKQWPTPAEVRKIADNMAAAETRFTLDPTQVYAYLSRSALGFESLDQVFSTPGDIAMQPILMTASMLVTYGPQEKDVWEFLDEAEEALEATDSIKPSVLPAMILRSRMPGAKSSG